MIAGGFFEDPFGSTLHGGDYAHAAPTVGAAQRAAGGFVYPGQANPSVGDRLRGAWEQLSGD